MKRILIIGIATLFITLSVKAQNFVFIGENSYPSSEQFTLQSNSEDEDINELKLVFAKDGDKGLIVLVQNSQTV